MKAQFFNHKNEKRMLSKKIWNIYLQSRLYGRKWLTIWKWNKIYLICILTIGKNQKVFLTVRELVWLTLHFLKRSWFETVVKYPLASPQFFWSLPKKLVLNSAENGGDFLWHSLNWTSRGMFNMSANSRGNKAIGVRNLYRIIFLFATQAKMISFSVMAKEIWSFGQICG